MISFLFVFTIVGCGQSSLTRTVSFYSTKKDRAIVLSNVMSGEEEGYMLINILSKKNGLLGQFIVPAIYPIEEVKGEWDDSANTVSVIYNSTIDNEWQFYYNYNTLEYQFKTKKVDRNASIKIINAQQNDIIVQDLLLGFQK